MCSQTSSPGLDASSSLPHLSRLNLLGASLVGTPAKSGLDNVGLTNETVNFMFPFDMSLISPGNDYLKLHSTPGGMPPPSGSMSLNSPVSCFTLLPALFLFFGVSVCS